MIALALILSACETKTPPAMDLATTNDLSNPFDMTYNVDLTVLHDLATPPNYSCQINMTSGALVDISGQAAGTCAACLANATAALDQKSCANMSSADCNPSGCQTNVTTCTSDPSTDANHLGCADYSVCLAMCTEGDTACAATCHGKTLSEALSKYQVALGCAQAYCICGTERQVDSAGHCH